MFIFRSEPARCTQTVNDLMRLRGNATSTVTNTITIVIRQLQREKRISQEKAKISLCRFKLSAKANSAKPDQTPQNEASDQVLHCLHTEKTFEI